MIELHIDGHWESADDELLATHILDGKADADTKSRDLSRNEEEHGLGRFLGEPEFEELSRQLLRRLQAMYDAGPDGVDPNELRERAVALSTWEWPNPVLLGRMLWTAAWLEELTGSLVRAENYYSRFLSQDSPEKRLRLLALNNVGVLRIRLGRAEGVRDLLEAGIWLLDEGTPERRALRQPTGLPAACFNLANLINLAVDYEALRDQVEEVLVGYMKQAPEDIRRVWLGEVPQKKKSARRPVRRGRGPRAAQDGAAAKDEPAQIEEAAEGEAGAADEEEDFGILKPKRSSFRRLAHFMTRLVAAAQQMAPSPGPSEQEIKECAEMQLSLWMPRPELDVAGLQGGKSWRELAQSLQHEDYAEAASLLYARQIPSSLTLEARNLVQWNARFARRDVDRARRHLSVGEYHDARALLTGTLEAVGQALASLAESGEEGHERDQARLEKIQSEATELQLEAERRQTEHERLDVHEERRRLTDKVDHFREHTVETLAQARREAEALLPEFRAFKPRLEQVIGEGMGNTLDALAESVTRHLRRLERQAVEAKVATARQTVHGLEPADAAKPVPEAAYRALDECRAMDPLGLVEDWDALEARLDNHQARHYLERAGRDASRDSEDLKQAERALGSALSLDPNLAAAAAPIFALRSLPKEAHTPGDLGRFRARLMETSRQLLQNQPLTSDAAWSADVRAPLVRRAGKLLGRLVRAFPGLGGELPKLWTDLTEAFKPAVERGRPQTVDEVDHMMLACLAACPMIDPGPVGSQDPRNPLNRLREECKRAKPIAQGERALHGAPPQREEAVSRFTEALDLGLEYPEHLRRAAVGLYLAKFGLGDPPRIQRDLLQEWATKEVPPEAIEQMRADDIQRRVHELREGVLEPEPPTDSDDDQVEPTEGTTWGMSE